MKYLWILAAAQMFLDIYFLLRIESLLTEIEKMKYKIHYLMRKEAIRSGRKAI